MLSLRVRSVRYEAQGILSFELVDPAGRELPPVQAGAHLDVRVPGGLTRRYSLCDAPWQRDHWRIAVLDVPSGRGGSRAMHQQVRAGQLLEVDGPHNFFALSADAQRSLLLAGGIGITPVMSMVEQLRRDGRDWALHYCTRTSALTAFADRLQGDVEAGRAFVHHDEGDPRRGLDIATLLARHDPGTHLYYCGPAGFMSAVQAATAHWPKEAVHFEFFGAEPGAAPAGAQALAGDAGGEVVLQRSGRSVPVQPGQTILQALRSVGVDCASSCESGICGTCAVGYVGGAPVHNDLILSDDERTRTVLVCCAKVGPAPLVLDL